MRWPWKAQLLSLQEAIDRSEERRLALEGQREFIRAQVREARQHRRANHITELIVGVARGQK